MMISKTFSYAIKVMVFIAKNGNKNTKLGIKEIANVTSSLQAFTAKILQVLGWKGLIESSKGPHGGFSIAGNLRKVSMTDVVKAIDGEDIFVNCGFGLKKIFGDQPLHYSL